MAYRAKLLALALFIGVGARAEAQDRYFDAAGTRLRYRDEGAGEAIVLVHGFTNRLELWTEAGIAQDLARDHRVIAFDLRGHGRSDKPHDAARYGREMTLDIVRVLDQLGIARAHIVGYSLGGHLVSQLLTLRPDRFITATLIAGAGRFDWDSLKSLQADTVANELERDCISRSLARRLATTPPSEDTLRVRAARCMADTTQDRFALAAMTRSWDGQRITPAAVAAVRTPTLGIVGSADPMLAEMQALVRIRPAVTLVVVDGASHSGAAGILSRPETLRAMRAFFAAHK